MTRASLLMIGLLSPFVFASCKAVSLGGSEEDADAGRDGGAKCLGPRPDPVDCIHGSPIYTCVAGENGGTWIRTCPEARKIDAGSQEVECLGPKPAEVDCFYGSPIYTCVAGENGGTWIRTCPEAPKIDAGSQEVECLGPKPAEVDCFYGSPIYTCVAGENGGTWIRTCPEPPKDNGADAGVPSCTESSRTVTIPGTVSYNAFQTGNIEIYLYESEPERCSENRSNPPMPNVLLVGQTTLSQPGPFSLKGKVVWVNQPPPSLILLAYYREGDACKAGSMLTVQTQDTSAVSISLQDGPCPGFE